ncbi:MAG: PadR family transcriptional regulator [Anaerolineales bacterium]|jgi:PadR family transcriptional regulator AphA
MIRYAILGLLSWQPLSGYDLKKIISESRVFYWSGNNNQIYRALIRLHDDGLVTRQVHLQESLPAKKIYSITQPGLDRLRQWVLSTMELPEFRSTFLIQLAWADQLTAAELDALLGRYEAEIDLQLRMLSAQSGRPESAPNRTPREAFLWEKISENQLSTYRNELDWVRSLRQELLQKWP